MKVLLLAGTAEARELAGLLSDEAGVAVVASLAGRTKTPAPLPCPMRMGAFGGVDALVAYLRTRSVDLLVDATHPYATVIPGQAVEAAARRGIPYLRVSRVPAWAPGPGDQWLVADDMASAAEMLGALAPRRALLTIGRKDLAAFRAVKSVQFTVRTIERVDTDDLPGARYVLERGPFDLDHERKLLCTYDIETLVTKNSGGPNDKLVAARLAGIPVVIVRRPPDGAGPVVRSVTDALDWVRKAAQSGAGSTGVLESSTSPIDD